MLVSSYLEKYNFCVDSSVCTGDWPIHHLCGFLCEGGGPALISQIAHPTVKLNRGLMCRTCDYDTEHNLYFWVNLCSTCRSVIQTSLSSIFITIFTKLWAENCFLILGVDSILDEKLNRKQKWLFLSLVYVIALSIINHT